VWCLSVEEEEMTKIFGSRCPLWLALIIAVYVIINFRVEAGFATPFERTIDGLVGGVVLLLLIYIAARFFGFLNPVDGEDPLLCCNDKKIEE